MLRYFLASRRKKFIFHFVSLQQSKFWPWMSCVDLGQHNQTHTHTQTYKWTSLPHRADDWSLGFTVGAQKQ